MTPAGDPISRPRRRQEVAMCRHQLLPLLALTFTLGAVSAQVCQAQWQPNGAPVCTAENSQVEPRVVSDGAGGAIITWWDTRPSVDAIYAQRVNAAGVPQWTADGVALCAGPAAHPAIASDGAGGAIVTWEDYRGVTSVYAQRVNAAGVPQWTADGVALCAGCGLPEIASDGAGSAIVTWAVSAIGSIYAQLVSGAGAPQWTTNGVALCPATAVLNTKVSFPTIVSDGAGGAIVTWEDIRNGTLDIYAQRVNAGVPQWTADGVALCTVVGDQSSPTIASDGAGGAIVTWMDGRVTTDPNDIYTQRVSADGVLQWTADGVALCTVGSDQAYPGIVSDGAAGAIVTWQDRRSGHRDVYAQRVNAAGAPQWTANGVALGLVADTMPPFSLNIPTIAMDGAGGAVVTCVNTDSTASGLHAQRVDQAGAPQWTAGGVALCTDTQGIEPKIVSDGAGGAIVTWIDSRGHGDIYAQRVYGSGGVTAVPPSSASAHFQLLAPFPNPSRDGQLGIRFNLPSSERVSAEVFDLAGHRVRTLATDREFPPGTQVLGWDGRNDTGVSLPNGVYFVEVRVGTHAEARRAILLH